MKKIFALVLSLCLVLSTFVAVSAQEQVFVEGNEVTLVDIEKNFDAQDAEVLYGAGISGSQVADPAGERTGMVAGGAISTGSTGYIGIKLPVIALNKGDVVEISLDVYSSADWEAKDSGSTQGVMLRAGDSWAPTGSWCQVLANGSAVSANTWTTLTNTFTVSNSVAGKGIWMQIRPNVTLDYFYIDNLSIKVTGARETVAYVNATMDDASTGVLKVNSTVAYADGKATVTMTGTGNNDMVGIKLVDANGAAITALNAGDVINWSVDINPSQSFTPAVGGTKGMFLRCGGANYAPADSQFKQLAPAVAIPANTTTTWSGSYAMAENYASTAIYMNIRPEFAGTMVLDNFKVEVLRSAEKVESGWADADYSIPASIGLANIPGTASGNDFSFPMQGVANYFSSQQASNNAYTATIKITPVTPVAKNGDWKISADLVMNGLVDSNGQTSVWVRCLDNTTSATQGYTVGYVQKNVTVADGTLHLEFDASQLIAGGGTSSSQTIAQFGISFDTSGICNYTDLAANTGSYAYNNVEFVSTINKIVADAEVDGNDVVLTLSNANDETYKVLGTLFVATYNNEKQMQLFGYEQVSEEIEAGDDATVTVTLPGTIGAGDDVRVFFWEADGSLTAIEDWTL